jgi:hypothetical protein
MYIDLKQDTDVLIFVLSKSKDMQTSHIMLLNIGYIGWALYWKTIGLGLFCYFLFIAVKYYRTDITKRMPARLNKHQVDNDEPPPFEIDEPGDDHIDDAPSSSSQFPAAYALAGELKQTIADSGHRQLIRQELLLAIQMVLFKPEYIILQQTSFKPAINNLIHTEIAKHCSIKLDEQELNMLWTK